MTMPTAMNCQNGSTSTNTRPYWITAIVLLAFFEVWAHAAYRTSFLLNVTNLQSIGVFAVAPLLLAVGQTYVIIAGGQ